jgi:tetratricopeptide (TPR) repeat protein
MKKNILFGILTICSPGLLYPDNPQPRHLEEIVYDENRGQIILYGGAEMPLGSGVNFPRSIGEWNGKAWKEFDLNGPGSRNGHAMVYQAEDKVTLLIGGSTETPEEAKENLDVWSWNGVVWKQINENCPVKSPEAAYDPIQNRVLVYGDAHQISRVWQGGDPRNYQLWEYKSNAWNKLSSEGPQISSPFEIAFDTKRKTLVIPTWNQGKSIVWEWRDNKWSQIICSDNCPDARNRFSLAYHPNEGGVFLFGGRNEGNPFLGDFWKWDGQIWTKMVLQEGPAKRAAATMEYGEDALILYGGVTEWGLTNEIWEWKKGAWNLMNRHYAMDAKRTADLLKNWLDGHPEDANVMLRYGSLLRNLNRPQEAELILKKAQVIKPHDHNILISLFIALHQLNKPSEKDIYLNAALQNSLIEGNAYRRLAYYFMSVQQFKESGLCLEKTILKSPQADDYYNLACCYAMTGNKEGAFVALDKAVAAGYNSKNQYENDADLEALRSDARWKVLILKLQ